MTIEFRPAKRENAPLLIGLAGGTGSGKTLSALLLARGLAGGEPFGAIDTENGRMKHYADLFPEMRHASLAAPFRPAKYAEAIEAGGSQFGVLIVDSASHEWAGDGGCLDWHDDIMGGDQSKNMAAWIEPKREHKRMVTRLLQVPAHVILCFRAEPKVEAVRRNGRLEVVPKTSLTGLDGWLPITEKMLPYELTCSFLLMADRPGVPRPIKLEDQHRPMVPLDTPLTEDVGRRLAAWARGSTSRESEAGMGARAHPLPRSERTGPTQTSAGADLGENASASRSDPDSQDVADDTIDRLTARILELAGPSKVDAVRAAIARNRDANTPAHHAHWLRDQLAKAEAQRDGARESFADRIPASAREAGK